MDALVRFHVLDGKVKQEGGVRGKGVDSAASRAARLGPSHRIGAKLKLRTWREGFSDSIDFVPYFFPLLQPSKRISIY